VQWVEEAGEEHKAAGSPKPYQEALLDLLELTEGEEETEAIVQDEKRFARIAKSFKKKRHKARRECQEARRSAVLYRGWLRHRARIVKRLRRRRVRRRQLACDAITLTTAQA
jgi:hypothetical protein